METQNNTDVAGPVVFAIVIAILIIAFIWATA